MHTRLDLAVALVAAAALGGLSVGASAQVTSPKEDHDAAADHEATAPAKTVSGRDYSPSAGRKYPMHVYFGDTHHHTANSGDAFFAGNRLTPGRRLSFRARRGNRLFLRRTRQAVAAARLPRGLRPRGGPGSRLRGLRRQSRARERPCGRALAEDAEGRRQGGEGRPERTDLRPGAGHAAQATDGSSHRRSGGEDRLAGVHGDRGQVQPAWRVHRHDRLRVDLGAGRQQPAPQRTVPRQQGQGRPDHSRSRRGRAKTRRSSGSGWRNTSRRPAAGCWRFRTTRTCPTGGCLPSWTSRASRSPRTTRAAARSGSR